FNARAPGDISVLSLHDALPIFAIPMGVVAAVTPSTNPTSTAIYKAIIAVKAGNAIVFSPHPRATGCVVETVRILSEAARAAGAPDRKSTRLNSSHVKSSYAVFC